MCCCSPVCRAGSYGYYKAELIRGPTRTGPWKTVDEVELATLSWVHWHNTQRLHGYLVETMACTGPGAMA